MKKPTQKDRRLIQDILGDGLIQLVKKVTRDELDTTASYEGGLFSHIGDVHTKQALAQIMFETRWIYKLGLTLLVKDEEQTAHVRAQIMGYGAVCEASCWMRSITGRRRTP